VRSSPIVFSLVLALIAWRIYRRIRRNIGRQPLRPRRALTSVCIFTALVLMLAWVSLAQPRLLAGVAGGLAPGVRLGLGGLRLTRFETTAEGHFYIPNTHIGVGLSILMVGRLGYRFMVLSDATVGMGHPPAMQSPLTFFIFGLMAGYYIVYQTGLFIHRRDARGSVQKGFALGDSGLDSARDGS